MMWNKVSKFNNSGEKVIFRSSLSGREISYDNSLGEHQVFLRNYNGTEEKYFGKYSSVKKVLAVAKKYMGENPNV